MERAVGEVTRVLVGLALFGCAAAAAFHITGTPIGPGELVGLLVVDASLAAMIAILVPLRYAANALPVAAFAGATGAFSFFGTTIALHGTPVAQEALLVLLGLIPLLAGCIAAGGASYLSRDVRRSRGGRPLRPRQT